MIGNSGSLKLTIEHATLTTSDRVPDTRFSSANKSVKTSDIAPHYQS